MEDNIIKEAWVLLFLSVTVVSGEICSYYDSFYVTQYKYCSTGCCGDYYNRYCCGDIGVGGIVGAVLGSIAFVAIVVSIIVAICCCRRSRGRGGQILQPATTTTAVIGMQTGAVGYGQPAYGQGGYVQPGVNQASYNQPGYNQAGYGQVGYPNTGFPVQMPATNVPQGSEQKWEAPPPPYQH